jgi:hypothetical protein
MILVLGLKVFFNYLLPLRHSKVFSPFSPENDFHYIKTHFLIICLMSLKYQYIQRYSNGYSHH